MINPAEADRIAQEWVAAWNRRDLDAILDHYTDDVQLTSPMVVQVLGDPRGTVIGKDNLRAYFARGLAAFPDLHFELLQVFSGVSSITAYYRGVKGMPVAEVLFMNDRGKINRAVVHYHTP